MTSNQHRDILNLVRKVALNPLIDLNEVFDELENLNLKNKRKAYVFCMTTTNNYIEMEGIPFQLKQPKFYVSVKVNKLKELLSFVYTSKIKYVELYLSRVSCSKKLYDHWDYPALKIYYKCKVHEPHFSYYCFLEFGSEIKVAMNFDEEM